MSRRVEDLWSVKDPFINRLARRVGCDIVEKHWRHDGRFGLAFRRSGEFAATMFGKDDCGKLYQCPFDHSATPAEIISKIEKASQRGFTLFVSDGIVKSVNDSSTIWPKHCSLDKMKVLLDLRGV